MGKKKNRQNSNMAVNTDCTESWDATNNQTADSDESCKHIVKVLKKWKNSENFKNSKENLHCGYCKASSQTDSQKSLQLCLTCGACSCGTDGENHAKKHHETPRSDCHCLTVDLESLSLWCYECKVEPIIPPKCRARIDEIKDKIKSVSEKHQAPRKPSSSACSENKALNKSQFIALNKEDKKALPVIPNKVKGLSNLGNTCFFNSVLQCLAQTPGLAECLREMRKGGEEISIVPKDSEPITGTLDKGGPVSGCLLDLITEMTSESSAPNSYNKSVVPRELMTELRKKCPQLMDGDQHDSHELLRQLLDVVFNEDLKRYRRILLKHTGLTGANPTEVAEKEKKWLKELDNLVPEQFVMKPYEVFRGTLVSELQCEECLNISSREENFLDLSLPVNVEKPQPPAFARRKYLSQNNSMNGKLPCTIQSSVTVDENKVEDVKSPKRVNRRGVKRNYQGIRDHGEGSITEEEKKENDADVEDNVENGADDQKEVFESGYSSEKPASSRTSPTTESRQNNGDADDSACASPSASISMPSECSSQKVSAAVSAALANLAADESSEQVVSLPDNTAKLPDSLSSNLPVANVLPYTESDNSSDSLRANPGFSSLDLSTESLQDIGLLSQERSCGSERDDSQSNDNSTISKDLGCLESMTSSQLTGSNFCQSTNISTFYQSEDYNSGPTITSLDEPSCSPNKVYNELELALKALEEEVKVEKEEEESQNHYEPERPCFNNSSFTETTVKNEFGDYNSGPTITSLDEPSCSPNEVHNDFKSALLALEEKIKAEKEEEESQNHYKTERPCFNNSSFTETTVKNEFGDYNSGPTITSLDEPSCSPNEVHNDFKSALSALEEKLKAEKEEEESQNHYKTERPCFNNSSFTETTVKNEFRDYNSGPTITPIEELSCAANEVCSDIDLEMKLSCFNNASPNSRSTETGIGNECGECNNGLTITAIEEHSCSPNEEGDKCDNLELRLLGEEERPDGIESKSLCFKNGSHDGYESLSNDEGQNVRSRPSSRLEHVNSKARSSPVDVSINPPLDGELVEKFLEDMILTEKLNLVTSNQEEERLCVACNSKSDFVDRNVASSPPSNNGHLGFVLVGGITSTTNNDISTKVESAFIKEIANSDTVKPSFNVTSNDVECAEVSPELYKKNHMTLAPRYQCEEGECSVLSCLNHFTAIEMMAGNNKAGCDMCTKRQNKGKEKEAKTVYTNSTKRLLISKPPPVLILHLKRFQVQMRSFRKLSCPVTFPLVLDIAPFCSKSCEKLLEKGKNQFLYSLYGVVEHSGTLHGGHYVAYVKVREGEQKPNQPREGSWYYISDSHVSPVKEETVLRTQAYLLFYERM